MAETGHEPFDTDRQQVGKLYAKALLGAAGDHAEQLIDELDSLVDEVLAKLPSIRAIFDSPRIAHSEKEAMLDKVFQGKMHPVLLNFLKVCSRRRRLDCLGAVRTEGRRQLNELAGRVEVQVSTATPMGDDRLQSLREQLAKLLGSEVVLSTSVDPELLGGLVVRVGDTVYDGSVSRRLDRFRKTALENTAATMRQSIDRFSS